MMTQTDVKRLMMPMSARWYAARQAESFVNFMMSPVLRTCEVISAYAETQKEVLKPTAKH